MSIFKDLPSSPLVDPIVNKSPVTLPCGKVSLRISICTCLGTFLLISSTKSLALILDLVLSNGRTRIMLYSYTPH